jgi:hypothetical protein
VSDWLRPDVAGLLDRHIETLEQLEMLLLLVNSAPAECRGELLAKGLRRPDEAAPVLQHLRVQGLITVQLKYNENVYRYSPANPQIDAAARELARVYWQEPIAVLKHLNANALSRVKSSAARAFADSFVLKRGRNWKDG